MNPSVGQLELALLRAHLHTFERLFYETLGPRYVQLDEARAQAAKLRARFVPAAHRESIAARDQARRSAEECAGALARPAADGEKLRRLRHELARSFHPDLATDPARRAVRENLMIEVNLAVKDGDVRRLEILEKALDHDENGDAARELANLIQSPINLLRDRHDYAVRHERDLMKQLSDYVLAQIEEAYQKGPRLVPATPSAPSQGQTTVVARALADLSRLSAVRQLPFPEVRSMGELSIRPLRDIDTPPKLVGPAKGVLGVPYGKAVILRLAATCLDLKPLARLDPGDLHGIIDEWPDFVNLNDDDVQPLARFRDLEVLCLGRTEVTGRMFDKFPTLRELRVLILEETQFDDAGLLRLEECVWMQRLDLSFTQVTGPGLRAIHNMTALRELSLYGTNTSDPDLFMLERIPGLRNLNLGLTNVTDGIASQLSHLKCLEVLNLGGTGVTDAVLDCLARLPALRELVLWETAITDAGVEKLKSFPSLRYLDVDQTKVTPEALRAFRPAFPEVRLPSDIWAEGA